MTEMQGQLTVTVGEGQWSDKIGAGAVGLFVAWPLAITAGMGAYKQKKLPGEVFQVIENCIVAGGKTVTVNGAGAKVEQGMIVCPGCKAQVPSGARFCNHCGASLCTKCPACGAEVSSDSAFCSANKAQKYIAAAAFCGGRFLFLRKYRHAADLFLFCSAHKRAEYGVSANICSCVGQIVQIACTFCALVIYLQ